MKLYNLYNEVILEGNLITENVSDNQIIDAINNRVNINITYDDYPNAKTQVAPSKRYIQVYALGYTKAGNKVIRAYQIFGGTKTVPNAWKLFRLDRIRSWMPTKVKWTAPISDKDASIPTYNERGDNSMAKVIYQAKPSEIQKQNKETKPNKEIKPDLNNQQKKQSSYINKS